MQFKKTAIAGNIASNVSALGAVKKLISFGIKMFFPRGLDVLYCRLDSSHC